MMRVVLLARSLGIGGAERQLVVLARGLHRQGHRVVVAVLYGGGPLERELRDAGIEVHDFAKRGRWDVVGFGLRLGRFFRRERPQIVHGFLPFQNVLALLGRPLCGARSVWGVRASSVEADAHDWLGYAVDAIERRLARFADLIIANSNAGRASVVARGFPSDRVVVIPNGIDIDRFRPDPDLGRGFREEIGVGPAVPLVGIVGRLVPEKDHASFVRAAALVAAEREEARFVCVGGGTPERAAALAALAEELGLGARLVWAGPRNDITAAYNALTVAVSASKTEAFSNAIAEAMACGVPCVVTDVGDSAMIVDGLGEVVPPGEPDEMAAAILRVIAAAAAGDVDHDAIRGRVVTAFSEARLIAETERRLLALIDEDRRR